MALIKFFQGGAISKYTVVVGEIETGKLVARGKRSMMSVVEEEPEIRPVTPISSYSRNQERMIPLVDDRQVYAVDLLFES